MSMEHGFLLEASMGTSQLSRAERETDTALAGAQKGIGAAILTHAAAHALVGSPLCIPLAIAVGAKVAADEINKQNKLALDQTQKQGV